MTNQEIIRRIIEAASISSINGDMLIQDTIEIGMKKALEFKDKEKKAIVESVPCEESNFERHHGYPMKDIESSSDKNDFKDIGMNIGYNQHVQEIQEWKEQQLNKLNP